MNAASQCPVLAAAAALCDILDQENCLLSAMDVPAANLLIAAKLQAADRLVAARRLGGPAPSPVSLAAAERLHGLAAQNKLLLERAITAQRRVMACIARAIPKANNRGGRYGAKGGAPTSGTIQPVALLARA